MKGKQQRRARAAPLPPRPEITEAWLDPTVNPASGSFEYIGNIRRTWSKEGAIELHFPSGEMIVWDGTTWHIPPPLARLDPVEIWGEEELRKRLERDRMRTADELEQLERLRNLVDVVESKTPDYTGEPPASETDDTSQLRMREKETIEDFARRKGLTVAQLETAADNWKATNGEITARETTSRSAAATPRPDWIEAHKRGVTVPDFIAEKFAAELADGTMHKGLFSRYENLRRDFYSYKRSNELPGWLRAIPTKEEWDKQHPPEPVPAEEAKRVWRDAQRIRRQHQRAFAAT